MKNKIQIKIIATMEFKPKPEYYPEDKRSMEAMLECELKNAKDDTFLYLDSINVEKWEFEGKIL